MQEVKEAKEQILLTNYERVRDGDIDPSYFAATSLDEASVLRSFGRPTYQNVTAEVTVDIGNLIFGGRFCDLVFKCEEDEKLTKEIHMYESKSNRFSITRFKSELDINSLRRVDEFDIFMMRLDRAFCDITDIMEMHDDDVEVEDEPEASWN